MTKAQSIGLHLFLVAVGTSIAASLVQIVQSGTWTWHALLIGAISGAISGAGGYVIRNWGSSAPTVAMLAGLVAILGVTSCTTAPANAGIVVRGPSYYAGAMNPGDTLTYTLSTTAVPGATGYRWTVTATATNGTWSGLTGLTSTAPSITFNPSAPAWDSVTFSVTVVGTSASRSSKAQSTPTTWRVYRYLPAPLAVTVDSSRVGPISLIIRSPGDSLDPQGRAFARVATGGTRQFCASVKFGSGHVAPTDTVSACLSLYTATYSAGRRVLTADEAAWLAGSCSPWSTCLGLGILRVRPDALAHRA